MLSFGERKLILKKNTKFIAENDVYYNNLLFESFYFGVKF